MFDIRRPRLVLLIGDEGALLAANGDDPVLFAAADDATARKNILACLARYPNAAVTVLYNGARQEFRFENLPPLGFLDRWKLVRRRLKQAFPKAYAVAGRVKGGHALLVGVQPNPALAAWVEALPTPFTTIGLLPAEAAALLLHLEPEAKKGWAMLLARFRTGGLRQIVTCDGRLVFTRLAPGSPSGALSMIADSRGYLARFGLTENANLRIVALTKHTGGLEDIKTVTPGHAARLCGFDLPETESDEADLLFAEFVARRGKPALALTPQALQDRKRQAAVAWVGWRAALAVFALAAVLTGWSSVGLLAQLYENHRASSALADLRDKMLAEQTALAPAGQPLDRLRAALERQRLFGESQAEPWDAMKKLAVSLDGKAFATTMEWREGGAMRVTLRLAADPSGAQDRESIVGDFRNLAAKAAEDLPGYDVAITRYPFPAMPQDILTNAASAATSPDRPEAEMTIGKRP